ncbi:MAG: PIN domain-containing protein [Proteobacteria bacterium]|nr:PIN domain-containing protein [Pseudomonadota bacterium]MDA0981735.1 PIN domain-containing protein [Pseudomonadota bacterium]
MRQREPAFVDSGAWIALALSRDPLHPQAREHWDMLCGGGAKLHTSVPVVIETFTFLERNANRDVALAWKDSIYAPATVRILPCELRDLESSWAYFRRGGLHKLSAVDATSFTIMKRARISLAFAFDHHFAAAGFRLVG